MAQLNIILHGLMGILEREDGIMAFLPDVMPEHVYRAGNWLAEIELQPGIYELTGVDAGTASIDRDKNVFVGDVGRPPTPGKEDVVIKLPRPAQIQSVRLATVLAGTDFTGPDAARLQGSKMATAQVLRYETPNLPSVRLGTHPWKPPQDTEVTFANLHIFAEEEVAEQATDEHARTAFTRLLKSFAGLDVQLGPERIPVFDEPPAGLTINVDPLETEDLGRRQARLSDLGDILRQTLPGVRLPVAAEGSPPDVSPLLLPFDDSTPTGSKMGSCTQIIARG